LVARRDQLRCDRALRQTSDALAVALARRIGASAGAMNLTTACAAAAQAIGTAFRMVRRGELDLAIAGGADSVLNLPTMLGLHLLGAPSVDTRFGDRLCRPFDADRSGLVAGEGAGMVVLESLSSAQARGATIYGEVLGFGTSLDAYQVTAPHPQGEGAATAMNRALADARLTPNAISHINAHGTSTPLNDPSETLAIKRVFAAGEHWRSLTVSANKSAFGHLIAAAGGPEFIATVLTVRHGMAPPTLNLERPDPACDLDYVPGIARRAPVTAALSNSFGFGGLNAVLAIGAWHHE
jgi:3-oxoacyl-[acyl-carrier-protein] synthase II